MIWRLMVLIETDEAGAVDAGLLAKAALESFAGVKTLTVAEWLFQEYEKPPRRFVEHPAAVAENRGRRRVRRV